MAQNKVNAADILNNNAAAQTTKILLEQADAEAKKQTTKKATRQKSNSAKAQKSTTAKTGRPEVDRRAKLNLTISDEHKDFLRLRCFELSTSRHIVSISDYIGELIEADMKKYNKKAKK